MDPTVFAGSLAMGCPAVHCVLAERMCREAKGPVCAQGACKAAPESIQARQDAQALAAAAAMCARPRQSGAVAADVDAQQLQRRCRLTLHGLITLKVQPGLARCLLHCL